MCDFHLDRSHAHATEFADVTKGCQFQGLVDEPLYLTTTGWCLFHSPKEHKQSWLPGYVDYFNQQIFTYIKQRIMQGGPIDLSGVIFPGDLKIEPDEYERKLALPRTLFLQCTFMGDFSIRDTIFTDIAAWDDSCFLGQPLFDNIIFNSDVTFDHATMPSAFFAGCKFYRHTYFQLTDFLCGLNFASCVFRGRVWYINAKFHGYDHFKNCEFHGEADFESISPVKESDKVGNTFSWVTFEDTQFYSRANFSNRQFLSRAEFSGVTFHVAPEFYGCTLHQDTDFSRATFLDRGKQRSSLNLGYYVRPVDAAKAYRTLKLAMGSVRNKEEEGRFYAYEQECIRADKNTPLVIRLLSNAYRLTSDYGQSITRPVISIIITFLVSWILYWMLIPPIPFQASEVGTVTRFALQQLAQPWSIAQASNMPIYILFLVIIQSLLYVIFVFLVILAVKRRFEMA